MFVIFAGIHKALDILRRNSRKNIGAFGVVVFITDGYWNTGGNPIGNITQLKKEGVSFLLAEQNTMVALRYANYGYILENGRVVMDGNSQELSENEDVKEFYLGLSGGDRRSFKDVKHYRRRKRWLT